MHLLSREEREFVFLYICVFRWWRWGGAYPENIHCRFSLRKTIFQGRRFAFLIFIFFVLMNYVFLQLNFLVNIFLHLRVGDVNHFGECPTLRGASCARRNIFQSAHFRKCNVTKVCTESCSSSAPPLPHVATDVLKDDILHFSAFCRRKKAFTGNSKTIRACPCWFKEYFLYLKEMFGSQGLLRYMTIFASWSHYWLVVCFTIHGLYPFAI